MDIFLPLLASTDSSLFNWVMETLEYSFYPVLLGVFVIASLGVPIPEDIPLIAAGILLKTRPDIAQWEWTILVSLAGIMSGDVILYSLGRKWGRDVFAHRSVSWLITPQRMEMMTARFHDWGVWACFFGRFMMGVRAIMCLTAGVTRFPFWKFFLADFAGALLSAPFFIVIGYVFAGMLDQLEAYIADAKIIILVVSVVGVLGIVWYEIRKMRRQRKADLAAAAAGTTTEAAESPVPPRPAGHAEPPLPPRRAGTAGIPAD